MGGWEVYFYNGIGGEVVDLKRAADETRQRFARRINEQCAASIVVRPKQTDPAQEQVDKTKAGTV